MDIEQFMQGYQAAWEARDDKLFQIWAKSTGTPLPARSPGDPLLRMVLDGVLSAEFDGKLCRTCRLWWHSTPQA